MLGATDEEQLRHVVENDSILFTFDDDFLALVQSEGLEHAGILFRNQANTGIGELVRSVDEFLEHVDSDWRGVHYL